MERSSTDLETFSTGSDWELEEVAVAKARSSRVTAAVCTLAYPATLLLKYAVGHSMFWYLTSFVSTLIVSVTGVLLWRRKQRRDAMALLRGDSNNLRALLARDDGELVRVRGHVVGPADAQTGIDDGAVWKRDVYRVPGTRFYTRAIVGSPIAAHDRAVDFLDYGREPPTMHALRASPTRPLLTLKVEGEVPRLPAPR